MIYSFVSASVQVGESLNLVLLFGIIVFLGTFGSRLVQKLHIPQVVGCVVVGVILGGDCLNVITRETVDIIKPFTMLALGFIGFMIGGELRSDIFKKYGKQFFIILFSQGIGTFLLVTLGTSTAVYLVTRQLSISVAVGLVFGAIASATAPAATTNVLWEYKTRGPLTAAILAIVALDDALALLLYRGAATGAQALTGMEHSSVLAGIAVLLGEIVGTVLLGFLAGGVLYFLLKFIRADDKVLGFSISCLLLVVGNSIIHGIDPILPAMTFGVTIANLARRRSRIIFDLVRKFSPPVYTAFFVLAGAHIEFGSMTLSMMALTAVYICFRVIGKVMGAWFGASYSGSPAVVRRYLGICLLPQAGVAIGLAILSGQLFGAIDPRIGRMIIIVVMTETFIIEILGPMLVKIGVKKAGEVGLNITEEDLIKTYKVKDVMDTEPTTIAQDLPLQEILEVFSTSDSVYYPVIDGESRIIGKITVTGIKDMFANRDVAGWLLACDVDEVVQDRTTPEKPLEEVMDHMRRYDLEHIPVVAYVDNDELVGVLDYRKINRKINAEVLHRRKLADGMTLATG
ncbi:MAG: cation:proton antiporter domain-containing protein [Planctomycetota bacterium]